MKKFYGSSMVFIPLICGIMSLIVFIVSFIFLIINFNLDTLACTISMFMVTIVILPWYIFCPKYIFYKVGFDEKGIYKFYKNKLIAFIDYKEIKEIRQNRGFRKPFGLIIIKTEFNKVNKNFKEYLLENITFQLTNKTLSELRKYKDKIKVDIKNDLGNKIDNIL